MTCKVTVEKSNMGWCSDGFEFRCDGLAPIAGFRL